MNGEMFEIQSEKKECRTGQEPKKSQKSKTLAQPWFPVHTDKCYTEM